jgi:hypothetical protein
MPRSAVPNDVCPLFGESSVKGFSQFFEVSWFYICQTSIQGSLGIPFGVPLNADIGGGHHCCPSSYIAFFDGALFRNPPPFTKGNGDIQESHLAQ